MLAGSIDRPERAMQLKLLLWNMEWLNDLFVAGNGPAAFRPDGEKPAHASGSATVLKRRKDVAAVIRELEPDIVVVVEGPNRNEELDLFFRTDVGPEWRTFLQPTSGSAQCLGAAINTPTGKFDVATTQRFDSAANPAFGEFLWDTDGDGVDERYRFERLPVDLEVGVAGGKRLRILGLHLKSKAIFDAYEWSKWWAVSGGNRRKILAQALFVRDQFVVPYLKDPATAGVPLVVCGDINDGPGLDASEKLLFGSGIEMLMGDSWTPDVVLGNALYDSLSDTAKRNMDFETLATSRFKDPIFNDVFHQEWIDHVLYSRNLGRQWVSGARIVRTALDGQQLFRKYPNASDHSPVVVTLDV
jgi:endonuclease/exonuclease/phosphatase family metal-dependent hydrolase